MKVALVYDRVNKWGGAERVLLALHKIFPKAPLYTSVYNEETASWAKDFSITTSFLQKLPYASSFHEILATSMPIAFESFSFDEYDVVITVTSEAAKGILTKSNTIHICYCLTPTRYLWSGCDDYFANPVFRILAKPATYYLRYWDKIAAQRPDYYIAISKEVQTRIQEYYGRTSSLIYPPVSLRDVKHQQTRKTSPYFFIVSRFVPYKKIELAVEACNALKLPLKIAGSGVLEQKLRSIAGPTIEFLGSLTDEQLVRYYKGCLALLFPGSEDFGITIVEAQRFGKPVIAFRGGGALETIIEGKTGEFFFPQTKEALIEKLATFHAGKYNASTCTKQSEKFSEHIFREKVLETIQRIVKSHKKDI